MTIEQFTKTKNGPTYYSVYHRFGGALVSVMDIKAKDKEDALAKVKEYLAQTIKDMQ